MAQDTVISVKDVSKRYRLGVIGGSTLSDDLKVWWAKIRNKPNPLAPIGKEVDPTREGDFFWALRGISFEVGKGEILGIIGKNGAGKSTLLKLLSQITGPTNGTISMMGRTASLLEVGTGFHTELTGRENIYLNGAILGMNKAEINKKIDEIIEFSGIKHHIDTPVKRYSSGMKVRLGFSVAAHLEPEILIIDEVLAVGDADFQKKCLGRMKEVSRSGRTILFVSHNMTAVQSLCTRTIWLKDGVVKANGDTRSVVSEYLGSSNEVNLKTKWEEGNAPSNDEIWLRSISISPTDSLKKLLTMADSFSVEIDLRSKVREFDGYNVVANFVNEQGVVVFGSGYMENQAKPIGGSQMRTTLTCRVPGNFMNSGIYKVELIVFKEGKVAFQAQDVVVFEINETPRAGAWYGKRAGVVRPQLSWELVSVAESV